MAQLSQRYAVERPWRLRCGVPCRDNHRHGLAHHHAMACANVVTRADHRPRTPPRDMAASISRWATLVRLRSTSSREPSAGWSPPQMTGPEGESRGRSRALGNNAASFVDTTVPARVASLSRSTIVLVSARPARSPVGARDGSEEAWSERGLSCGAIKPVCRRRAPWLPRRDCGLVA